MAFYGCFMLHVTALTSYHINAVSVDGFNIFVYLDFYYILYVNGITTTQSLLRSSFCFCSSVLSATTNSSMCKLRHFLSQHQGMPAHTPIPTHWNKKSCCLVLYFAFFVFPPPIHESAWGGTWVEWWLGPSRVVPLWPCCSNNNQSVVFSRAMSESNHGNGMYHKATRMSDYMIDKMTQLLHLERYSVYNFTKMI